jgi:hypothetical protein
VAEQHRGPLPPVSSRCKVCGPTSMLAIWPFSSCRCFTHGGGATVDRARYDIISILGKRITVVTSRFVNAISAGVGRI